LRVPVIRPAESTQTARVFVEGVEKYASIPVREAEVDVPAVYENAGSRMLVGSSSRVMGSPVIRSARGLKGCAARRPWRT
jgi:hypothetical protein